jgi:hypothetical protein
MDFNNFCFILIEKTHSLSKILVILQGVAFFKTRYATQYNLEAQL